MEMFLDYYLEQKIDAIIQELNQSTPGKRIGIVSDKYACGLDFGATIRSTFPNYIKFAYYKRPKNWHCLSDDEKISNINYYQYNTKEIIRILNKIKMNKPLTNIQGQFIEELFENYLIVENDYYEEYNEIMFEDCLF